MTDNKLAEQSICKAALEIDRGLVHASLGGGVYKQRVARSGQGKSGGFRTILFFEQGGHTFFIFGFAKNKKETLSATELLELKRLAKETFTYDEKAIKQLLFTKALEEICNGEPL